MILRTSPERQQRFITEFQQLVGWPSMSSQDQQDLRTLFETVTDESFPGAVLPRPASGWIEYYAAADTGQDWRSLSPMVKAFVGPTVTNFIGLGTALDMNDPVDAWLAAWHFAGIERFNTGGDPYREAIVKAGLVRLYDCHRTALRPEKTQPRSTRQILAEFKMALVTGDRQEAERAITFLRANVRLDAMNIRFLEVQLEESFGAWQRLSEQIFFHELCYTRRPPRVTAAMVEAVYHTVVEPSEMMDGPQAALDAFRSRVGGRYGRLLDMCPPHPSLPVAKMFLLAAGVDEHVDVKAVERLEQYRVNWSQDEVSSFDQLLSLIKKPTIAPQKVTRLSWADVWHQLDLAKEETEPADSQRARAVLLSAVDTQTLDSYRTAITYVNRLPTVERENLLKIPGFAGLWADIQRYAVDNIVPTNWLEWIELLPKLSFEEARVCAERAAAEWPIADQLQHPGDIQALVTALGRSLETGEQRLYDALPHLLAWVQTDDRWPNPEMIPLYEQLLLLLLLNDRRTPNVLQAILILADALLSLGLSQSAYVSLLSDLRDAARQLDGIGHVDWLLDVAELIAMHSCPNPESRSSLWAQILATAGRFVSRLSAAQIAILNELLTILGLQDASPIVAQAVATSDSLVPAKRLDGFYLAIYTLTESVGERLARILTRLYPGIRVELSSDKTASARLTSMARNATLFVICARSAKHAATDAIRQQRPSERPIVYALGKGSSSIVAAVEAHLSSVTP